jgi:3-hydroxybutyryl-CoA dehydrogenase
MHARLGVRCVCELMKVSPIQHVGICGIGQMGAAAAVCFERAGYRVMLWARDANKLRAVSPELVELRAFLDRHVGPPVRADGTIELTADLNDLASRSELVMDAIGEVMDQKIDLFRRAQTSGRRDAIFITTTSGLSITEMGRGAGCGERLVGTHFWNPPHLMPLVEVVRGADTPDALMDGVCAIARSIGKIPVRVERDVPGFIGNRLLHALWREAINLVERGIASPADIDRVARLTFGLRVPAVGPLENMDLVGLDLVRAIHEYLLKDLSDAKQPIAALAERVEGGRLGMKSGEGFHDWRQRSSKDLIARRDRQIVRQLEFLREMDAL